MVCVYCGGQTKVTNSRLQQRNNQVWRRRRCLDCGAIFTTTEAIAYDIAFSVEKGAQIEPFLSEKLYMEFLLALQDRKNCYIEARELTTQVIRNLLKRRQKASVQPTEITTEAAKVLKRFNRRAWLRYVAEHPSAQK